MVIRLTSFFSGWRLIMGLLILIFLAAGFIVITLMTPTGLVIVNNQTEAFRLAIPVLDAHGFLPALYTCDGENFSPPLKLTNPPPAARSLVLIIDDPDAPAGKFIHWLVWNIDPATTRIDERSLPAGAMTGTNSFGRVGYGGPCPPAGVHRYLFKLYALDTELALPVSTTEPELLSAIKEHIMAEAQAEAKYQRHP